MAAVPAPASPEPPALDEPAPAPGPAARPAQAAVRPASYLAISLLFSILVFAFFLVGEKGFLKVRQQRRDLQRLQREVAALDAENRRLQSEVTALRNDPRAVEKIAREKLGLVRPGEVVLVLPEGWETRVSPTPSPPPTSPPPTTR